MTKQHILEEIKRTAEANKGKPLGRTRFAQETGIKETDWGGRYWARWGDAVREAGYKPSDYQEAFDKSLLLEKLADYIRELGHFPVGNELKLKRRSDPEFPSRNVFTRFGSKDQLAATVVNHCKSKGGFIDVIAICEALCSVERPTEDDSQDEFEIGFVYLLKSGKYYKIGRSNAAGRRERELQIQLPEAANHVHVIRMDDPIGIEAYWHNRFAPKRLRKEAEWFDLDTSDIRTFQRRKFI
jgi:Meiotically up-regulated gene 113